jgi:hypothetical protein
VAPQANQKKQGSRKEEQGVVERERQICMMMAMRERERAYRRNAILDKVSEHAYTYSPIKACMLHCSLHIL